MDEKSESVNTQFFIDELARISAEQDRLYRSLSARIHTLEDNRKGSMLEEDPMKPLMGIIVLSIAMEIIIPLIVEGVKKWRSSSSSQLSD